MILRGTLGKCENVSFLSEMAPSPLIPERTRGRMHSMNGTRPRNLAASLGRAPVAYRKSQMRLASELTWGSSPSDRIFAFTFIWQLPLSRVTNGSAQIQ